jgi:hypothetical protein
MWRAFKKLSFFATGAGVAVDLAATKASPFVATVGNLVAVAGGSAYSIFKNFETAGDISGQKQNCSEILDEMHSWTEADNTEDLLRRLEITEEEARNLLTRINTVDGNTKRGYIYAAINTAVQVTLGAISIGINAAASQKSDDDIWHDSIHIMNMFLIPTLIFSQYIFHSVFVARSLRRMNNQSIGLKSNLEKLKNSVQVQVLKLNKLISEIDNYYQQVRELNTRIEGDNIRLVANRDRTKQINRQPIPVGEEERIREELTGLLEERGILEQEVISSMERKTLLIDILRTLVRDTDKLIMELRINFAQHGRFDDVVQHNQAIRSQLDHEIGGDPSSLLLGV